MNSSTGCNSDKPLHLGVMAKYWEPGRVKTRLGASIGMRRAAAIHRVFCQHLANGLLNVADEQSFVITPASRQSEFAELLPAAWGIQLQTDGDLGHRMQDWFMSDGPAPDGPAQRRLNRLLIGADCPTLTEATIRQTRRMLGDHDIVLGPAIDGGYYLIALREGWRPEYAALLDAIPWSSDQVFGITCQRAQAAGLTLATLEPLEDVDTIAELDRLRESLQNRPLDLRGDSLRQAIDQIMSEEDAA